jgi:hypothetical protein
MNTINILEITDQKQLTAYMRDYDFQVHFMRSLDVTFKAKMQKIENIVDHKLLHAEFFDRLIGVLEGLDAAITAINVKTLKTTDEQEKERLEEEEDRRTEFLHRRENQQRFEE